ncbi:MAG: tudor domain-containing protein [Stellaceae bacterium]
MSITRVLGGMAVASLICCSLALPAAADGLSSFEQAMKEAPPGSLTYKSAKALGDNGVVLEGVVLTPPPEKNQKGKTEPIAIKRITIEDFDFAALDKKTPPKFARVRAEGIVIVGKPAEGIDLSQLAGIDQVTADFQLDYRLDPEKKTMTLNRLELDLNGLARIELSMILDGVSAESVDKPESAMNDASLRTASLVFEDNSLLGKALPAAGKVLGMEPAVLVTTGKTMLGALRAGQGKAALDALDALASYLEDYKQPKGPLRVTLDPPAKTSAAAFADMKNPDEAIAALGLVVSYAGTRPQPAPANTTPASTGGNAGCTAGARFFVMHEEAWRSVTAREASKSGDRCIARIDGGTDDDITFALDKARAWSIDGPGKPVAKCNGGDKVLVEYKDGGWYPSKVTGDAAAGAKCPIKYDSDDSKEAVELKRVRQLD